MAEIRGPDYELAEKDYINGMKYKDIAEKYNVSLNTVKSWKQRYKWNRDGVRTKEKVCTQKKNAKKKIQDPVPKEVEDVLINSELTDKQKFFCIYQVKYFNATKAYQKAYGCDYNTAMVNGCNLLRNTKIQSLISKLKADKLNRAMLSPDDIFQKYIDIAFADITDYVEFGQEEIKVMGPFGPIKVKDANGVEKELTKMVNVVKFRESIHVDGTIISEVKQGKDGASIKLQDKMKALQWLSDRLDLLTHETREKLELEKQRFELAKIKAGNVEEEEVEDDGFIDALKGKVAEVWTDEDTE